LEGHKIINSIKGMDGFLPYFHPIGCYFIDFIHELYKLLMEIPTFSPLLYHASSLQLIATWMKHNKNEKLFSYFHVGDSCRRIHETYDEIAT
jgi:hypothetical protein